MSIPKSVTKVKAKGLEYTSNVDKCNYLIHELCYGALRDVAKFIRAEFRKAYYQQFKRHTGDGGKAIKYKVWSNAKTTALRVQVGIRTGQVDGFYSLFQEVGTDRQPKLGLLHDSVYKNVDKIIEIESKYLSALDDEAEATRLASDTTDMED